MVLCGLWMSMSGQNAQQRGLLELADSLGTSSHFRQAHAMVDSLLYHTEDQVLEEYRLELRALKARFYEKQEENEEALQLALEVTEAAETDGLANVECISRLTLALIYEKTNDMDRCWQNLEAVSSLIDANGLDEHRAHYFVRKSSYYRLNEQPDSAIHYAELALEWGERLGQGWHYTDANLLLGLLKTDSDPLEAVGYLRAASRMYVRMNIFDAAGHMHLNISRIYAKLDSLKVSSLHADSAIWYYQRKGIPIPYYFYQSKAKIFERMGQFDSAYVYSVKQFKAFSEEEQTKQLAEINRITAEFEDQKKEQALKEQLSINARQQLVLKRTVILAVVIMVVLWLLFFAYWKLRQKNQSIRLQAKQLESSLNRQKVLLAEVQHRVKNNLQLIIALLDLQKEAPNSKSLSDITNDSQRRIRSMAFLHDKIYLSDDLEHVNLQTYLNEVASLIKSSYASKEQQIDIVVNAEINTASIDKAIPLGLITVELLSNSFKHGFANRQRGRIEIRTKEVKEGEFCCLLSYSDDGVGFDALPEGDGLGMEIITGLVGQLHGKLTVDGKDGFNAEIRF